MATCNNRRAPALSCYRLKTGQLLVSRWTSLHKHKCAIICKSENVFPDANHVPCSKSFFLPFNLAGPHFHTLQRSVPILLETEHAIQITIFKHGRAPMVCHMGIAGNPPYFIDIPFSLNVGHLVSPASDSVTSRAKNHILIYNWRGSRRNGKLIGLLP